MNFSNTLEIIFLIIKFVFAGWALLKLLESKEINELLYNTKVIIVGIFTIFVAYTSYSTVDYIKKLEWRDIHSAELRENNRCGGYYPFEMSVGYNDGDGYSTYTRCFKSKEIGEFLGFSE